MGDDGWYQSCVNITFVNIEDIDTLFYRMDGGSWVEYTDTFSICESDGHHLSWY